MSSLYDDDYFLPNHVDIISNNSNTSRIYALNIYMDDGFVYYTRTFKKIFVILSNIFPLFNFGLFIMKNIAQYVKMSFTKRKLAGLLFENGDTKSKKIFPKKIDEMNNNSKAKKSNKVLLIVNKSEKELMKERDIMKNDKIFELNYTKKKDIIKKEKEKDDISNNSIINNSMVGGNIILNNKILGASLNDDNKKLKLCSTKNFNFNKSSSNNDPFKLNSSFESIKIRTINGKKKYLFPFYYYFLDFIFDNIINPRKFFCISKKYLTVYYFMCNIYDISTHLIFFKHYYLLDGYIKDKIYRENDCCHQFLDTININDHKTMEKLSRNLKTIRNRKPFEYKNYFLNY